MHGSVHGWCMAWCMGGDDGGDVDDVMGVGKMQWYTTWIGEVGLGHGGRSNIPQH